MTIDQVVQLTGTAGLIAVLAYTVKLLWAAHIKADQEKTDLLAALTAAVDRLADSLELAAPAAKAPAPRGGRPRR